MIDTIIVSGGNIHSDFALDFLKKNEACLIAADKGLEFFLEHQLLPDAVIGDFDSLSEDGKKFLEIQEEKSMDSEIPYGGMTEWKLQKGFGNEKKEIKVIRLRPEKDDSDTQSAMNYAIRTGAKRDSDLWCDRKQSRPSDGEFRTPYPGTKPGGRSNTCGSV